MTTTNVLARPTVLYDGRCRVCATAESQLRDLDKEQVLDWLDLHDPAVRARFPKIDWLRAEEEVHLIHVDGRVRTGARAVRDIAQLIGGEVGATAARAMDLPGVRDAADLIYRIVSENRHRLGTVAGKQ
jgi:predicted DCC family thiol-disulfide oxidoreductase YuxK